MAPRVFISYRTADGADKATALARDLGRVFGDDQVFLDKDDLRGGSRWAQEIGHALRARPVLLLLLTPQLLGAADADGRRRIDDPDDPVRREVDVALAAGAELIPLLCDGVDAVPEGPGLPAPFGRLAERTWRRLRAYDWASDVQRLVADLRAAGIAPAGLPAAHRRGIGLALAGAAGLALAGGAWWQARRRSDGLSGHREARMGPDSVRVQLQRTGDKLTLESEPIDIRARSDWADYRGFWQGRFGHPLDAVRYRGEGRVLSALGSALEIDLGFKLLSVPGDQPVDGGNLSLALTPAGALEGSRWLNSLQASVPARLERLR